jgi:molecular chaperone DnaJ
VTIVDFYAVLGVRRGATVAEVRRAYQKRARQIHPDLNPGDAAAAERFRVISEAFAVLADPQRRAEYDRSGAPAPSPPSVPEVGFEGFDFSAEVRMGATEFREILDGVFRSRKRGERDAARGEDLEQRAQVSFEESLSGTRRRLHVTRLANCGACMGAGETPVAPSRCARCGGAGQVRSRRGRMIFSTRCGDCGGSGVLSRQACPRCAGEGRLMQSDWLEVEIPPGVTTGARIRVPGLGNAGRRGGRPGDFVLVCEVEAHPIFHRDGDDLRCVLPVTITEAALGAHVDVPTPAGTVTIEIPAGTQSGQRFRLRKRGAPLVGQKARGDLYVEVRVLVPKVQDEQSAELLREFARRNPHDPRRAAAAPAAGRASGGKA